MKKLFITGSNGLLGQAMVKIFKSQFEISACDLSRQAFEDLSYPHNYVQLDLTERTNVSRVFNEIKPDIIINTAAYTNVDRCESENEICWSVNVRAVENIIEACGSFKPIFVQISTDYVFDGTSAPYRESDPPKPLGYYGLSKFSAEKLLKASHLEYIIARTMILFGTGKHVRLNFATWVIDQLKRKNKIRVVNDQIGNPTYVDDLTEAVLRLLNEQEYGLFHISGNEVCNRFEFACKIADVFNLDKNLIEEIKTADLGQQAARPMNSSFILEKLENTIDWVPSNIVNALQRLKTRMPL
jgi:dTDP-4-dehydrorhamnose reductase